MSRVLTLLTVLWVTGVTSWAHADEPTIDGNVNLAWWSNNVSASALDPSFDIGSVGGNADLWWRRRWGLGGSLFQSDVAEANSAAGQDFTSIDVKRRILSPTQNNFLALGLGYENIGLGVDGNTQGPRLLLEGRLGLTPIVYVYGQTAWLPALEDTGRIADPDGLELEAGVSINPLPYLSFRAGYREFRLDFKSLEGANESTRSKGVVFGAGIHF